MTLKPGDKAPEFVLPDDEGNERSLSDLLSDGPLILYFYPADFTPGCTKEACAIRDMHAEIRAVGLSVAGLSPQDPVSHARFREEYDLPFTLLSDTDKSVIRAWDVDGPFGAGVRRATFLVDEKGTIRDTVVADLRISRHEEFIRKAVDLRDAAGHGAAARAEATRPAP